MLAHILEQTLDVAPRVAQNRLLLPPGGDTYLVRTAQNVDGAWQWQDSRQSVKASSPDEILIEIDTGLLDHLRSLPLSKVVVEVGAYMLPTAVQGDDERPYYPFNVLLVEARSGYILAVELMAPNPSIAAMWGRLAETVADKLAAYSNLPGKINVDNALLRDLLQPLSQELGLKIEIVRRLSALEEAQASMRELWY